MFSIKSLIPILFNFFFEIIAALAIDHINADQPLETLESVLSEKLIKQNYGKKFIY